MNLFKSHFAFSSRERSGILALIGCMLLGLGVYHFWPVSQEVLSTPEEQQELLAIQQHIDSVKAINKTKAAPKVYPFNPNFITDYKGYVLGMSVEEIDRLHRFRESGKWINSISDFKTVTQVSDSLLNTISPYFKFPEWVTNPKKKKTAFGKSNASKKSLNEITVDALIQYDGIDEALAVKVFNERKKMGGFLIDVQLYDIWGIPRRAVRDILDDYTVKTPPVIEKIDLNLTSASDLATIKYINFDLAKEIVDYRILREGIRSVEELENIEGMTPFKLSRIKLYVFVSQPK